MKPRIKSPLPPPEPLMLLMHQIEDSRRKKRRSSSSSIPSRKRSNASSSSTNDSPSSEEVVGAAQETKELPRHRPTVLRNHGASAGASMSHSHSQIMALPVIPPTATARIHSMKEYFGETGKCGLCQIKVGDLLINE